MRGLAAGAEVTIELDPEPGRDPRSFAARVLSIQDSAARLAVDELPAQLVARLRPGALGQLTFERESTLVAVRGIALSYRRDELEFVVAEGIRLTDRRTANRQPIVARMRASQMADDGRVVGTTTPTATKNLSMRGALVARRPTLGRGPRWTIELMLPSAAAPVRCEAVLARETNNHLALKFVNLGDADRRRLATALLAGET